MTYFCDFHDEIQLKMMQFLTISYYFHCFPINKISYFGKHSGKISSSARSLFPLLSFFGYLTLLNNPPSHTPENNATEVEIQKNNKAFCLREFCKRLKDALPLTESICVSISNIIFVTGALSRQQRSSKGKEWKMWPAYHAAFQ